MEQIPTIKSKVLKFFGKFKTVKYKKGDIILRSDEQNNPYLYFLHKGFVRLYAITDSKEEITLTIIKPYSYFPLINVLNNLPNRYNFEAMSAAEISRAPKKQVLEFLKENTDVLLDVTSRFGRGLYGLLNSMEYLMKGAARSRILMLFTTYAKRFGSKHKLGIMIDLPLTHKNVANSLGLARETVSRELDKILEEKILLREKKYYIIANTKKIEKELSLTSMEGF